MRTLNERSIKKLKGIHPKLILLMTVAIAGSPIQFVITDGLRTAKQQQDLYAQGRTKPGKIVTNADGIKNKSNHQPKDDGFGYAVDLYAADDNNNVKLNDVEGLKEIAVHIKKVAEKWNIPIQWGGDWKNFKDYPHFELKA